MKLIKINENLFDIRLDFKQTNTENFLSTWVYKIKILFSKYTYYI